MKALTTELNEWQIMRSKKINLIVVPLLLTACSHNDGPLVQDVYNNQYDCAADWNTDTCEEENNNASSSYYAGSYGSNRYLGPQYYQNNREVSFRGHTLRPRSNLSVGQPTVSTTLKSSSLSSPETQDEKKNITPPHRLAT
jgi:hypothetical protein